MNVGKWHVIQIAKHVLTKKSGSNDWKMNVPRRRVMAQMFSCDLSIENEQHLGSTQK